MPQPAANFVQQVARCSVRRTSLTATGNLQKFRFAFAPFRVTVNCYRINLQNGVISDAWQWQTEKNSSPTAPLISCFKCLHTLYLYVIQASATALVL